MAPRIRLMAPETPSLPFPAMPTGQAMVLPTLLELPPRSLTQ